MINFFRENAGSNENYQSFEQVFSTMQDKLATTIGTLLVKTSQLEELHITPKEIAESEASLQEILEQLRSFISTTPSLTISQWIQYRKHIIAISTLVDPDELQVTAETKDMAGVMRSELDTVLETIDTTASEHFDLQQDPTVPEDQYLDIIKDVLAARSDSFCEEQDLLETFLLTNATIILTLPDNYQFKTYEKLSQPKQEAFATQLLATHCSSLETLTAAEEHFLLLMTVFRDYPDQSIIALSPWFPLNPARVIPIWNESKPKATTLFYFCQFAQSDEVGVSGLQTLGDDYGIYHYGRYKPEYLIEILTDERTEAESTADFDLAIMAYHDHNGAAFDTMVTDKVLVGNLSSNRQQALKIVEVGSIYNLIRRLTILQRKFPHRRISVAYMFAHGTDSSMILSANNKIDQVAVTKLMSPGTHRIIDAMLTEDATIVLLSCSTGKDGAIAESVHTLFNRTVIGPTEPTNLEEISFVDGDPIITYSGEVSATVFR